MMHLFMRPYLRRAVLLVGMVLIVSAFRVARTECRTEPAVDESPPSAAPTDGRIPSDFTTRFGTEVEECATDVRLSMPFAALGVVTIAGAVMSRPKRP
jgi:hypothetical protein